MYNHKKKNEFIMYKSMIFEWRTIKKKLILMVFSNKSKFLTTLLEKKKEKKTLFNMSNVVH